jgi:hypothetical protein
MLTLKCQIEIRSKSTKKTYGSTMRTALRFLGCEKTGWLKLNKIRKEEAGKRG